MRLRVLAPAWRIAALAAAIVFVGAGVISAQQMPDPKEIAGIPLPVGDVARGTVVVRVIRGSLANNIADQSVDLHGAGATRSMRTDATGRAQFADLPVGAKVKATATVGDERLESQEFAVPGNGGVRLLLVATDPEAQKRAAEDTRLAAAPAQPGVVVLGDQSRFVFELADGSLSVFNILQILNTARTPVQPSLPIVFELPRRATGATVLQNSSPQATAADGKVTVTGPFAPGTTLVQFAYSMPYSSGNLTIEQVMPAPLNRVIVLAQKAGEMRLSSAQMTEQREMNAEGQTYIVGQGPAVAAGGVVAFSFANLPHEARWPRFVAVGLAIAILLAGAWASRRPRPDTADKGLQRLEAKRDQLFAELTALETAHRDGRLEPGRYTAQRRDLVAALERIYAEIDRRAA